MVLSARFSFSASQPCAPSLNITQFTKHSITDVPLCLAPASIVNCAVFKSTSSNRPKKVPLAPMVNSAGRNGRSTVPNGEDLVIYPFLVVGEYCPVVRP